MLKLYVDRLGEAGAPLGPRIDSELKNHFDYMEGALAGQDYFVGNRFTAADIQLSFVLDAGALACSYSGTELDVLLSSAERTVRISSM